MSNRRTMLDFPRNEPGLVDEFIGTAFDAVYSVYRNLDEILTVDANTIKALEAAIAAARSELAAGKYALDAKEAAESVLGAVTAAIEARDAAESFTIQSLAYLELSQAAAIQVNGDRVAVEQLAQEASDSAAAAAESAASINATEVPAPNRIPKSTSAGHLASGWIPPDIAAMPAEVGILTNHTIYALKHGADNTGATSASAALSSAWAEVRSVIDAGWTMAPIQLDIAPGVYLLDEPTDWGGAFGWNLNIMAVGAVFLCKTPGKVSLDMVGTRGVSVHGLSLRGDQTAMPLAGLLLGPSNTEVCGNNAFYGLKTDGFFERTAVWNIGSETTEWDFCYFQNRHNGEDSWTYLADAFNNWGVTSPFRSVRNTMVWASMTCNNFKSCRFAHHGGKSPLYIDGVFHWTWDMGCYYLTWGTAGITIRCRNNSYRNVNLEIKGLFESGGASMYGGLDDCVRIVCDDGVNTAIEGLTLNAGQPQSKRAVIRVETPAGAEMTSGMVKISGLDLKISRTINAGTATKLFSGGRLMLNGSINCRDSKLVNLEQLRGFQGSLYTEDYSQITKPSESLPFSVLVFDEVSNSGRAITVAGVGAGELNIIAGTTPQVKVSSTAASANMSITAKGPDGRVQIGSGLSASLPIELPSYTKATLPVASVWTRYMIIVSDATSGPALCRSNGTTWIDLRTQAAVA